MISKLASYTVVSEWNNVYIMPSVTFDELIAHYTLYMEKIEPNAGSTNGFKSQS